MSTIRTRISGKITCTLLTLGSLCALSGIVQKRILDPHETLIGTGGIPKFDTYTVFLFPSAEWTQSQQQDQLATLFDVFLSFGDAIGTNHVAIWFVQSDRKTLDVERSKRLCDALKLDYNDGPFIVLATWNLEAASPRAREKPIIISLHNVPADRAVRILNVLEQDLRRGTSVRRTALIWEELKQRLPPFIELIDTLLKKR